MSIYSGYGAQSEYSRALDTRRGDYSGITYIRSYSSGSGFYSTDHSDRYTTPSLNEESIRSAIMSGNMSMRIDADTLQSFRSRNPPIADAVIDRYAVQLRQVMREEELRGAREGTPVDPALVSMRGDLERLSNNINSQARTDRAADSTFANRAKGYGPAPTS